MGNALQRIFSPKSREEHGVAVAEKAEAFADRGGVGLQDEVAAAGFAGGSEGAYEHEQGGAGEVEVGEEGIHDFEIAGRVEKKAGAAVSSNELSMVGGSDAFQHARGGGADGDDAAAFGFGLVDGAGRFFGNMKS